MNLLEKLTTQIECVGLPLFAVSLTAVPRTNTPVMLMLHWHGFRKNPDKRLKLVGPQPVPVPGSALQINETWHDVATIDQAMLDAAWRLGAWELERDEKRGCNYPGASEVEAVECQQAFASGPKPYKEGWLAEAPDQEELTRLAARVGYLRWVFRPVHSGIWGNTAQDETLDGNGGREPPCPVMPRNVVGPKISRTKYQLGHSCRIVLP